MARIAVSDLPVPPVAIPDPEHIRKRLAALLTEACVLRRQLRVSALAAREGERLGRLLGAAGPVAPGTH